MYLGIDCYSPLTRARAEAAKAAGFDFAGRYLIPPEQYANGLSEKEAHVISAAGLGLLCVFETQADRAKGGAKAGEKDGATAKKCAMRIGMPEDGIIYFAVDFGASVEDFQAIAEYMREAERCVAPYRLGVYGCYAIVEAMAIRGIGEAYWQCIGWSGGLKSPHLTVYQRYWSGAEAAKAAAGKIGVSVDVNECRSLEKAGIWMYEEDKKMEINRMIEAMTDEQAARIVEKAQQHFAKMPLPGSWDAEDELKDAIHAGITDGTNPMSMATRLEAAVMVKRAIASQNEEDSYCEACDVSKILDGMEDDGK